MQQDAEECWSQLLTILSRKVPQVPGIAAAPSAPAATGGSALGDNKSAISDLFMGSMEQRYTPRPKRKTRGERRGNSIDQ